MDSTRSHVKIYNISPDTAEDFVFDYDIHTDDLLTEMAPDLDRWGSIGWMQLEEYEYNPHRHTIHLTLETKWEPPTQWLQQASHNCPYFENKLVTMSPIQKDETCVTGVAIMDGEILQNKYIFQMEPEEVAKYYDDDKYPAHELDKLDNQIWDSIGKFLTVCEQFYIGKEENNHD